MSTAERALLAVKAAGRKAGVELLRFNPTNSLDAARREGQALLPGQLARLGDAGFAGWGLRPTFADLQSGRLLQAEGLFIRV
jgi:hypothetical protein